MRLSIAVYLLIGAAFCNHAQAGRHSRSSYTTHSMVELKEEDFGITKGQHVKKFTWTTANGFSVSVISYGAIIQSILVPDKNGELSDVVLGFDDLQSYVDRNSPYFGASVGRVANRIGGATFLIDGVRYNVTKNLGQNSLHGGLIGFNKKVWNATVVGNAVTLASLSADGEEGYPGAVIATATFEVTASGVLQLQYKASSTKRTPINIVNHSYFNLAGHETGAVEIYNHVLNVNADLITETTNDSIPTGRFLKVAGTPFDLRVEKRLGDVLDERPELFDDNFCVNTYGSKNTIFVSRSCHPQSGRVLEVHSNQPGVQVYTSNNLPLPSEPALIGKHGVGYRKHGAVCFETQNYPDAVNHPNFPNSILTPGEEYYHKIVYAFGVENKNVPCVHMTY